MDDALTESILCQTALRHLTLQGSADGKRLFNSCMTVASGASLCVVKNLHRLKNCLLTAGYNHLSHTLAVVHHELLIRKVDKQDANLSTIIGVDSAWRVYHSDAMLICKSAAWAHLCLVAFRQSDVQSGWNEAALKDSRTSAFCSTAKIQLGGTVCG